MNKSQHTARYKKLVRELKVARVRAELTQLELATKLGVYSSFVSKCESGERRLDVVELAEVLRVLGVKLSTFLAEIGLE
jgi:transcriptional regulator with XRE-family HTH domain